VTRPILGVHDGMPTLRSEAVAPAASCSAAIEHPDRHKFQTARPTPWCALPGSASVASSAGYTPAPQSFGTVLPAVGEFVVAVFAPIGPRPPSGR
jgi:hypothetical protein